MSSFLPSTPIQPTSKLLKSRGKSLAPLTPRGGAQDLLCSTCWTSVCGWAAVRPLQRLTLSKLPHGARGQAFPADWEPSRLVTSSASASCPSLVGNCFCPPLKMGQFPSG